MMGSSPSNGVRETYTVIVTVSFLSGLLLITRLLVCNCTKDHSKFASCSLVERSSMRLTICPCMNGANEAFLSATEFLLSLSFLMSFTISLFGIFSWTTSDLAHVGFSRPFGIAFLIVKTWNDVKSFRQVAASRIWRGLISTTRVELTGCRI